MPSIMSLEGHRGGQPILWVPTQYPASLQGTDNAVMAWMRAQPLPVALAASIGLSLGVGFVLTTVALKVMGKSGAPAAAPKPSGAVAGLGMTKQKLAATRRRLDQIGVRYTVDGDTLVVSGADFGKVVALAKGSSFVTAPVGSGQIRLQGAGLKGARYSKPDLKDPSIAALLKGQRDGMAGRAYLPPAAHVEKYRMGFDIGKKFASAKGGLKGAAKKRSR